MPTGTTARILAPVPDPVPELEPKRKRGRPPKALRAQRDRSPSVTPVLKSVITVHRPNGVPETDVQRLQKELNELKAKFANMDATATTSKNNRAGSVIEMMEDDPRHQGNFRDDIYGANVFQPLGAKPLIYPNYPIPEHHSVHLPAVSDRIRASLANPTHFVDFNELLPKNRVPVARSTKKSSVTVGEAIVTWDQGSTSQKSDIVCFASWARAFSVFHQYRMFYNPELAIPLARYYDLIASFAIDTPKGHIETADWLE